MSPTLLRIIRTSLAAVAVTVGVFGTQAALPGHAAAQSTEGTGSNIGSMPKGTVGLGLIGAEVGLVVPAAFGLTDLWAEITFPVIGAGAGAAIGYFAIDDGNDDGALGVALLTGGVVLAIPSLVLAMSLGRYDPESETASLDAPKLSPEQRRRRQAGPGLVRMADDGGLFLATPAVEFGRLERETGGGQRVRMAVLSGAF